MARHFAPIAEAALKEKIDVLIEDDPQALIEALGSDIKVKFDTENFYHRANDSADAALKSFLGLHTLSTGLTFCGCQAGGDWECPVCFLTYFDGKKLRGYVPTAGNPWNTDTKAAYGNDRAADRANLEKRWPAEYAERYAGVDDAHFEALDLVHDKFDPAAMLAEVAAHITPRPAAPQRAAATTGHRGVAAVVEVGVVIEELRTEAASLIAGDPDRLAAVTAVLHRAHDELKALRKRKVRRS